MEDLRFTLQEPPKPKRISKMSFRHLLPHIRTPSDEAQASERGHERVSVKHPRGRAPTLHLRLSGLDFSPVLKALRSPPRTPNSFNSHSVHETTPTRSIAGRFSEGFLDVRYPRFRNAPSSGPASPITPNTPWIVTEPTPRPSFSSDRTANPRLPTIYDEHSHRPAHVREDTVSSTMSNLGVEVMTLSESPPDPGFVLPIPSRSRDRESHSLHITQTVCYVHPCTAASGADLRFLFLQGFGHFRDVPINHRHNQIAQKTSPVDERGAVLAPLQPPQQRLPSRVSEDSDASSAIIFTAARLTRANTVTSATSVVVGHTVTWDDSARRGQQSTVTYEHPLADPPSVAYI